jgi:phospholipid/cholesterol/gamma-HCH transport system substrate-binding protein
MRRAHATRLDPLRVGVLALVVLLIGVYFAFAGANPFATPFELKAVFADAQNIGQRSPVRVAGVEVGKVTNVEPAEGDSQASVVTMELSDEALPIHADATLRIRPRIFLEGNFFVDLRPGRPDEPDVADGETIPMTQTASSVQLDQVLGTLKTNTREELRKLLAGYGAALTGKPAPGEDDDQDPDAKGDTAGQALNDSLDYSPAALRGVALVNQALLGTELHDLSKLIARGQRVSAALGRREGALKDLVTNFNLTTAALASQETSLRQSVRLLPGVLEAAGPAFDNLNRAFPPTRAFAREILPGVRETPAAIAASFPWIRQTRALVSPPELQGLLDDLGPSIAKLAETTDSTTEFLPRLDLVDRCALDVVLPTGDHVIEDGPFTSGIANYKEFLQALVGLAGEGGSFDGNGPFTRVFAGGGDLPPLGTGVLPGTERRFWNPVVPALGSRPARPAKRPPYRPGFPCHRNKRPDLDSARTAAP